MEDKNNNTVEDVQEVTESAVENQEPNDDGEESKSSKNTKNTSYVKIREDKAREKLLRELGVKDVEEAKSKLANADKALEKVEEIERKLQAQETEKVNSKKVKLLTEILDKEKVFDSEALINYIDLDSVELDAAGRISSEDSKEIVNQLKEIKPNYFGKEFIKSDTYKRGDSSQDKPANDYKEDYDAGNYQAVIAKFLKNKK